MSALTKQKDYKPNCKMLNNTNVRVKKEVQMSLKKDKLVNLQNYFKGVCSLCSLTKKRSYHSLATQHHILWLEPVFSVVLTNHEYFRERK